MAAWRQGIAAVLAGLAVGAASGQSSQLGPSEAVRCLTPDAAGRADVEFPFAQWKNGVDGLVKVRLSFEAADAAPRVELLKRQGGDEFVEAVRRHVASWRVPCLAAGAAPVQPTFRDPGQPPQAQVYAREAAFVLREEIEDYVRGLRMPCLSGEATTVDQVYVFLFEEEAYGLKPLTLKQLLGVTKGIRKSTLQLDTRTMGCPFELRLRYMQPFLPNQVSIPGPAMIERQPLVRLLSGLELDLPARSLDAVFADDTTITVPCIKFDLKPQGETS